MEALLVLLGGSVLVFGLIAVFTILDGLLLAQLWTWFIIPIFHLPGITIGQAIGLSMVISFTTNQSNPYKGESKDGIVVFGEYVLKLLFYWGLAYVIHFFV
jgi:hypothetical protein